MMQLLGHLQHWLARVGGPRPLRDWLIIVAFVLVLLMGTVLWSLQLFQTVASGGVIDPRVEVGGESEREAPSPTEKVKQLYAARRSEADAHRAGTYVTTDPSQ